MLNSLLYATSFTMFRGEMGGGGRTVERFWRFREISRTLVKGKNRVKNTNIALNVNTLFILPSHSIKAFLLATMLAMRVIADGGISNKSGKAARRMGNSQALLTSPS